MAYILGLILSYLLLYKYWVLITVIYFSGLILPLPMNTMLVATGAFASQGYFDIYLSFIVSEVANVLGDYTGYFITRYWNKDIILKLKLDHVSYFRRLEIFLKNHSRLTITLTRFLGTPGFIVNLMAGLAPIPPARFIAYDILGNALDIGFFLAFGYIAGAVWENYSDILGTVGWIVLLVLVIIIVAWLLRTGKEHKKSTVRDN